MASRQILRQMWRAVAMFLKSPVGGKAKWLAASLLILMLSINGMNVVNSYVGRYFMSSIESKDTSGFVFYAWMYVAVFAASTVVAVFFRFSEERLGLLWRDYLTRRIVGIYIDRRMYLRLEHSAITNPDQRMTEDVRQLTATTLSFVLMISNATLTVLSFSGVLWAISPKLFVIAVLYAIAGSALTVLLGRPLIRLNYQQSDFEANFRSELIRVRESGDGIALTGNEGRIRGRLMSRLDDVVENLKRIISVNRNLNFFTGGYNYMIQLIPTLIAAPLFIDHGVEFGVIGQAAMAFATLLGAFSLVVTQFQAISSYASVITRLGEFVAASERAISRDKASRIVYSTDADHFSCSELTLHAPDNGEKVLIRNLNASFVSGKRVLVYGANQAACVALFRAAAGIHEAGTGKIVRPPPGKLIFLPEQPYLVPSTLRALLATAGGSHEITDDEIVCALREVGLESAVKEHGGLDTERNWLEVLSFEEQQRLSLAGVVLAKPDFVFFAQLDSALGDLEQERFLKLLAEHGLTYVSFGDRGPDPGLYDAFLELNNDGSWTWTDLH